MPITVIQTASDNLVQGIISEPQCVNRYGQIIKREIGRLANMVEGILYYSGLQGGAPSPALTGEIDLPEMIGGIVDSLEGLTRPTGVSIRVSMSGAPQVVQGDAMGLRLMLENLLVNAFRHGRPENERQEHEIRLIISKHSLGKVRFVIEDEGNGIPQRDASRIFEPFYRRQETVQKQIPGSGLGLHLARRIAVLLGGTISLESPYLDPAGRMHCGCRFIVELPLKGNATNAG